MGSAHPSTLPNTLPAPLPLCSIWHLPLSYSLGDWPAEAGDALLCGLYECDGAPGCDPRQPTLRPNTTGGQDELLGTGLLRFSSFAGKEVVALDFFR